MIFFLIKVSNKGNAKIQKKTKNEKIYIKWNKKRKLAVLFFIVAFYLLHSRQRLVNKTAEPDTAANPKSTRCYKVLLEYIFMITVFT